MSRAAFIQTNKQLFRYFLVLDFEATCIMYKKIEPQEIIEFPMVKLDAHSLQIASTFQKYVRPIHNPQLAPFCTELTGITQDIVDNAQTFPKVFEEAKEWIATECNGETFAFVTCGDWDLKSMLPEQCALCNLNPPDYFRRWINIRKVYADKFGIFPKTMRDMLSRLGLRHLGHLHSGYDDCVNIANITSELCRRGAVLRQTT